MTTINNFNHNVAFGKKQAKAENKDEKQKANFQTKALNAAKNPVVLGTAASGIALVGGGVAYAKNKAVVNQFVKELPAKASECFQNVCSFVKEKMPSCKKAAE